MLGERIRTNDATCEVGSRSRRNCSKRKTFDCKDLYASTATLAYSATQDTRKCPQPVEIPERKKISHPAHKFWLWHLQDFFELGVILLRKKLYTQATKNLEKASRIWDSEPEELAQVQAHDCFAC